MVRFAMDTAITQQTLILRDGRKLGYAEWGDLGGKPIFLFGGSSSARFARHPDESILIEMGIHLYTFDRPGMGLSDRQPGRTLLDWARDVRQFAGQKGITRFAIIAASQGGPYGAACAYALADVLSSVTLVSAVSPLDDPQIMATQSRAIKFNIFLARHAPWLLAMQLGSLKFMLKGERPWQLLRTVFNNLPAGDQAIIQQSRIPEMMIEDMREAIRQGGGGGADDMRACVVEWGFRLEEIRTKVFLWQGEADPNVTPTMGRYLASRIPDCEATFVANAGHFLLFSHWREILAQCLRSTPSPQSAK
jgi:pimeloyl-ACP methyl ester carboxylesterase